MTRRWWPLLLIPILVVWLAAPRPSSQLGAGTTGFGTTTGAPSAGVAQLAEHPAPDFRAGEVAGSNPASGEPSSGGAPHPSEKLGDWSCSDPPLCGETPQPRIVDGISGEATWWYSFGPGIYAALRPDLGSKGDLVIVCGGKPFHCLTLPVTTSCACKGPNSDRLIDLSLDAFRSFADPSVGVIRVTLQVLK